MPVVLDICATFQGSSGDCEPGHSLVNLINTSSRNTLEVVTWTASLESSCTFHLGHISTQMRYTDTAQQIRASAKPSNEVVSNSLHTSSLSAVMELYYRHTTITVLLTITCRMEHVVAQLVAALCYKSEGRGFDSQ
jgi:hypothetical protein